MLKLNSSGTVTSSERLIAEWVTASGPWSATRRLLSFRRMRSLSSLRFCSTCSSSSSSVVKLRREALRALRCERLEKRDSTLISPASRTRSDAPILRMSDEVCGREAAQACKDGSKRGCGLGDDVAETQGVRSQSRPRGVNALLLMPSPPPLLTLASTLASTFSSP